MLIIFKTERTGKMEQKLPENTYTTTVKMLTDVKFAGGIFSLMFSAAIKAIN